MRILLTGAGGPASIGVARSLTRAGHQLVGVDCDPNALHFAKTTWKHQVPRADDERYIECLNEIIEQYGIDFVHAQPDPEVFVISRERKQIKAKTFLPDHQTVGVCQDKMVCNFILDAHRIPVPASMPIVQLSDLSRAWDRFMPISGKMWVRHTTGAAGRGSYLARAERFDEVKMWIGSQNGWGNFMASEYLPGRLVTWQSIWKDGSLVCSQSRERLGWAMADRSPSGVTGVTGVAKTITRKDVEQIGIAACRAMKRPNGIFGVDMKENAAGVPCVTEINIGRFFTTIDFFTQLGLNMPDIHVRTAFGQKVDWKPCEDDWYWLRSMDAEPHLARSIAW